jgi:molybdopterin converting factor small subunit
VVDVRLPGTLTPLFPGLSRKPEVDGGCATVLEVIDRLEAQWPGLRDRLVAEGPVLRSHIHVYVDGERAGLDSPVAERSRLDVIAAISGG